MTEPLTPNPHDEPTPDETFTWTGDQEGDGAQGHAEHADHSDAGSTGSTGSTGSAGASSSTSGASSATALLETLREAVDDLAERASPTVREF